MSEPLPLEFSDEPPAVSGWVPAARRLMAVLVAMPISKTEPCGVQRFSFFHFTKRAARSAGLNEPVRRLSVVQRRRDESSLHVPAGWWWVPKPRISVTGSAVSDGRGRNSTGTPRASPASEPQRPPRRRWCFGIIDDVAMTG